MDLKKVILLDDSQDLRAAAYAFINPMSALGLLYFLKKNDVKAVV